jgi:5-methylphenazine-1-carboxylate 1-monooxygenase
MMVDVVASEHDVDVAIVGAGIGGLTTGLALRAIGLRAVVFEQAREVHELGVGLNVLPDAVRCLAGLGLAAPLAAIGVATRELVLMDRDGEIVSRMLRGLHSGHDMPQVSAHRGQLQALLLKAFVGRSGNDSIVTDRRLISLREGADKVDLEFRSHDEADHVVSAGLVIGADGIHSVVRSTLHPDCGKVRWAGAQIWRGATRWPTFLDGRTMIIAGGMAAKLVLYPIGPGNEDGTVLTNWAVLRRVTDTPGDPPERARWSRIVDRGFPLTELQHFRVSAIDARGLIDATEQVYEYPLCDRDPLPSWSTPRVTLLGDAAHAMYPVGSNGATQAIMDAACLAAALEPAARSGLGSRDRRLASALKDYERSRLPCTTAIVVDNRAGGPEAVIDRYEAEHGLALPPR